jgi:hypothetical protein
VANGRQALIPLFARHDVSREKGINLDRVDKALLVLPLLPAADLLSTLFSLQYGGEEIGILARPVLEQYGAYGLIPLAVSASAIFLVFMQVVIRIKKLFVEELKVRWTGWILTVPIYWLFMLQGVYVSTVIMNLLVPFSSVLTETIVMRIAVACAYFACISVLTRPQMRQLPS